MWAYFELGIPTRISGATPRVISHEGRYVVFFVCVGYKLLALIPPGINAEVLFLKSYTSTPSSVITLLLLYMWKDGKVKIDSLSDTRVERGRRSLISPFGLAHLVDKQHTNDLSRTHGMYYAVRACPYRYRLPAVLFLLIMNLRSRGDSLGDGR